ncbi:MAG TPA: ZIP family metal transporter [Thermoanaerobaculia bacterium]|nr:ZIP family metal transporter [Thermoanaerobaculia bacterium]
MPSSSPLLLSFAIVAFGFLAGIIPFFFRWTHATAHRWIALGAGTILGAAFLHMLPEAFELAGAGSMIFAVGGFVILYLFEQFSLKHPHHEESGEFYEIGFLTFVGLTIHDLVDGIALGSGDQIPALTPAIFIALVLHKIPTTFALSLLLLHGGYPRRRILLFLAVLLFAIPIGTLISGGLIAGFGENYGVTVGRLIGFSAGTFIYIGAYELLPEMQRTAKPGFGIGFFFLMGVSVMFVLMLVHPVV